VAHYRIARTMPNGWKMRLDMISYDGSFGDTITDLDNVVLLEVGQLSAEFDGLPYGLINPMTFDFRLVWDNLPGAMQTYLEAGEDTFANPAGYRRNTWYLYTDRGTNGATWTLEFVGCEDNIEALELAPLENGQFSYNVELVDVAYYWLKTLPTYAAFGTVALALSGASLYDSEKNAWQIKLVGSGLFEREQLHEFWSINTTAKFAKVEDVMTILNDLAFHFSDSLTHCAANDGFDYGENLKTIFTQAVDWYRPDSITSLPRNAAATASVVGDLYMCATITPGSGGDPIGGMLAPQDKYGIVNPNEAPYDILRQLCEQCGVRVGYRFSYTGSGASTQIRVIFDVKTITQGRDATKTSETVDDTLSLSDALTYSSITKRGDNILKAEVRFETESDKDATDIVKIQRGARASRSMNMEPRLHNIPVHILDNNPDETWPRFKAPIRQTNQLFISGSVYGGLFGAANNFIKLHEKTKIVYGAGGSDYVEVDPDGLKNPVKATDFKTNAATQATYFLQLNDCQVNGCISAALCELLLKVFSDENNAIVEVEWPLQVSSKVMPDYIAGKYALTNEAVTKFTAIDWARAMPVSIAVDLMQGRVTHRYYMVSA
jgi:hypothetical protein